MTHVRRDLQRQVRVLSVDSGCIFNQRYQNSTAPEPERLLQANQWLLDRLAEPNVEIVLISGSSPKYKRSRPAYVALQEFCLAVKTVKLDPYVVADSLLDQPHGASFANIINNEPFNFNKSFIDESKFLIIYAQMHKIAVENPGANIQFDFFESKEEVLAGDNYNLDNDGLIDLFSRHPDLIPDNVQLNLHIVTKQQIVSNQKSLQGTGAKDEDYRINLWRILECAKMFEYWDMQNGFGIPRENILRTLVDERGSRLERFKHGRFPIRIIEREELSTAPVDVLARLETKIQECSQLFLPEVHEQHNESVEFIGALQNLHAQLSADVEKQVTKALSLEVIKASNAMLIAHETIGMLDMLKSSSSQGEKLACIQLYHQTCHHRSPRSNFLKAVAFIAIVAAGLVVGGVVGLGCGAAVGAVLGVAVGAAVTGIGAGAVSGFLLFRPDKTTRMAQRAATIAGNHYKAIDVDAASVEMLSRSR